MRRLHRSQVRRCNIEAAQKGKSPLELLGRRVGRDQAHGNNQEV